MKDKILLGLTLAGVAFSGYLSAIKLFSGACAFNERCPLFLGYPTCYYGFVMFFAMFVIVLLRLLEKIERQRAFGYVALIAVAGICFSGYFTFRELPKIADEGIRAYVLGLPTCAYGFVVYVLVFVTALRIPQQNQDR